MAVIQGYQKRLPQRVEKNTVEQQHKLLQEIDRPENLGLRCFWKIINRTRKPKASQVRPFQKSDGTVLTDIKEIREAWGDYYEELFTPKNYGYDENFKNLVENTVARVDTSAKDDSDLLSTPITIIEIERAIGNLKNNKSPGPDGVQSEHIKYGGEQIVTIMCDLYNGMIRTEHRPPSMKTGIIVPIPKGRKDSSIPDKNRGITL